MNLIPCELPRRHKSPKYLEWAPAIKEFISMDAECVRFDGVIGQSEVQQIRNCIAKLYDGRAKVHVIDGSVYLTKEA